MRYFFIFLLLGGGLFSLGAAQTPGGTFSASTRFNGDDFLLGFDGGLGIEEWRSTLTAGFFFRPGPKKVWVETDPHYFDQYRERRYMIVLRAEKRFKLMELGSDSEWEAFIACDGGITFGDFKGSNVKPYSGFYAGPGGGLDILLDQSFAIQAGYTYLPLHTESISNHRISLTFRGLFF